MKVSNVLFPLFLTSVLFGGCYGAQVDEDFDPDLMEEVGSLEQLLPKGTIGAVNGQGDYCSDPSNPCVTGEGDCDRATECTGGSICASNNGSKFGFSSATDVCVPAHCTNAALDAGNGETGIDCGGPCGTCRLNCSGTSGSATFCDGCLCASGQGDCDSANECQSGLVCASNNGPKFGLGATFDVCVPAHCTNGVLNAANGETGVDTGGPCSTNTTPPPPTVNLFFSEYVEGPSTNHHLEIYNAGTAVGTCSIRLYVGGSTTPSTIPLANTIAPGGLYVICRSGADTVPGIPPCNEKVATLLFDGDDALELVCNGVTQDIFGQIGFDPGRGWGAATDLTYTRDHTLRRKCSVTTGDRNGADVFVPSTEWDGFAVNYTDLGTRCPD